MKRIYFVFATLSILSFTSCQNDFSDNSATMEQEMIDDTRIANTYIISFTSNYLTPLKELNIQFASREEKRVYAEKYRENMIEKINIFFDEKNIQKENVIYYYTSTLTGFAVQLNPQDAEALRNDNRIASVDADAEVKIPAYTVESVEAGSSRAQTTPCGISNAGGSADGSTKTNWIWIIDSGVDTDHPDLNINTSTPYAKYFTGASLEDCLGHGTHVAGIAAAMDNGIGVIGVSAGATVVPVRIFGCVGSTTTSMIISAMDHVGTYDVSGDVCNMSLGGYVGGSCSSSYSGKTSLENLSSGGTFVTIAAGNDGATAGNYGPACVNASNICTVASMTCAKKWSSFSNKGKPPVDWIATGTSVYSTYLSGGYATLSGTSMAAPTVAGVCHARGDLPASGGTVVKAGVTYDIAVR